MVQKLSYTANSITLGTGTSRVILGADSGNLIVKDSDANTSIVEPGNGIVGGAAVVTYANPAALPFNPISSAGSLAYTTSTGALYMSNGSGWYKITLVNTAPSITLSSTTATPNKNALTLDFTYTTTEPEGTPVTVSLANSGIASTGNVAITHTTSNNHVRLVFDGTTTYEGDATVTLTVTDGVNTAAGTITITTAYYESSNTRYNSLLLKAKSDVALTTAQKSLTFDGTGDYLTSSSVDTAGTGEFTAEAFFYANSLPSVGCIMAQRATTPSTNNYAQWLVYVQSNGNLAWYNGVSGQRVVETGAGGVVANRWYHVAITRNSSNVATMWLDGVSVGTRSHTSNWNYAPFTIGANGDGTEAFNGFISNVRWIVGTALYTSNFIVPTSPLTAVTNTKFLVAQGNTTDNSGQNETVSTSGDVAVSNSSPFQSGDNNTFDDASDSNHIITGNGDVPQGSYSPFREPGYAVDFAGEWTKIKDSTFTFGTGDYTIEGWIFPHGTGNCDVIDLRGGGNFNQGPALTLKSGNKIWPYYGGGQFTTGNIAIKPNEWSHIALVRTSGTLKAFVNGLQDFSVSDTTNCNGTSSVDNGLGANYSGASKFDGHLFDWRVTNTAVYTSNFAPPTEPLTAISGTMLHVCRGPRITDYSSNAYVLEGQGGNNSPSQIAFTPFDRDNAYSTSDHVGSVYFDGTSGNWLTVADSDDLNVGTGDFTLECWIKPETGGTGGYGGIFGSYAYDNNMLQMQISNSGTLRFVRPSGALGAGTTNMWSKTGDWHHIAMCRSGTTLRGFVDGKQEISGTYSNSIDWGHNTNGAVVGITDRTSYPTNYLYKGYISNLRLVKGTALYTSNFTPSTSPLTAVSNTKLLLNFADSKVFDASQSTKSLTLDGARASSEQQHFSENTIAFDGTNDYIAVKEGLEVFDLSSSKEEDFTIECWIYKTSTSKDCWISHRDNSSTELSINLDASTSGYSAGRINVEYDSTQYVVNVGIARNQWQHIAFQRTGDLLHWYTDGVSKDTRTEPASLDVYSADFQIGRFGSSQFYYNGYMHDFRFSRGIARYPYEATPVTLSQTNSGMKKPDGTFPSATASNTILLACHTSTPTTEGSSGGYTFTNNNSVAETTTPMPKGAPAGMTGMQFTSSSSMYLENNNSEIPALGTGDWTIEYWVWHDTLTADQVHVAVHQFNPAILYDHSQAKWSIYNGAHHYVDPITPEVNKWYHFAWVHNNTDGKIRIFVNGSFVDEYTENFNLTGQRYYIGRDSTGKYMDGTISNLRIVKGQALYTKDFTPSTSAFE